jgi:hypothetical protein
VRRVRRACAGADLEILDMSIEVTVFIGDISSKGVEMKFLAPPRVGEGIDIQPPSFATPVQGTITKLIHTVYVDAGSEPRIYAVVTPGPI